MNPTPALCLLLFTLPVMIAACVAKPLTEQQEYERENKRQVDRENYANCIWLYSRSGVPFVHYDHFHDEHTSHHYVRSDLIQNGCRRVLAGHWIPY